MNNFHIPVLLKEVIDLLQIKKGNKYIDATLGGAGHTQEILSQGGIVLGIDQDQEALDYVGEKIKNQKSKIKSKLILTKGNFKDIDEIAHLNNFDKVSGILFDLGVSSYQIENQDRGFSFLKEGPLDMRMDKDSPVTAEYLVNLLGKDELVNLFTVFGEETRARHVAKSILEKRKVKAIKTTAELLETIKNAYGIRGDLSDFQKNLIGQKVFQALRIAVNNELESIKIALPKALQLLESKGRIVAISFQSLEDKIVKENFINFENSNMGKIITKKIITASKEESNTNPRAKSAKLRVFEKN